MALHVRTTQDSLLSRLSLAHASKSIGLPPGHSPNAAVSAAVVVVVCVCNSRVVETCRLSARYSAAWCSVQRACAAVQVRTDRECRICSSLPLDPEFPGIFHLHRSIIHPNTVFPPHTITLLITRLAENSPLMSSFDQNNRE